MPRTVAALIELDGATARVVGRTDDPAIVSALRDHIAADHRRALARVTPPVRPVDDPAEPAR
jgi:hypothetical protein